MNNQPKKGEWVVYKPVAIVQRKQQLRRFAHRVGDILPVYSTESGVVLTKTSAPFLRSFEPPELAFPSKNNAIEYIRLVEQYNEVKDPKENDSVCLLNKLQHLVVPRQKDLFVDNQG